MARRWMGVVLLAGWLGVSASARAQGPMPAASGDLPPHAFDDAPPHTAPGAAPAPAPAPAPTGPEACPPGLPVAPPVDGPFPSGGEVVPDNGFSNVHPDQVRRSPRFYLEADYLLWWVRKDTVPALASSGSINDAVPGAFGQPGTTALLGPGGFGSNNASGARVTAIYWFDQDHTFGVDASGFWFADASRQAQVGGNGTPGSPVIARPFINPNVGADDADPISVPGVQAGQLLVDLTRRFWGGDANLRCSECVDFGPLSRVTFLVGGRYLSLEENLSFTEHVGDLLDSDGVPGNDYKLFDQFRTQNRFYGAQIGLDTESRVGPVVFNLTGKVAVGQTHQTVKTGANTIVTEPDGTVFADSTRGLLVQPSNLGSFSRNRLGVVPEVIASLSWEFNENFRISVGYNFLWWNSVVRPGEQIDPVVNVGAVGDVGQLGSIARPGVPFQSASFWAQGVSAGLQVSY
jgi:hypothetical protein